jgi:hypothetical protein
MGYLAYTPDERLVDQRGRPYFLWDQDLTLDEFEQRLRDPSHEVRAYFIAKLMREAKPDDVFRFVTRADIDAHWPDVQHRLGRSRAFWEWILARWRERDE